MSAGVAVLAVGLVLLVASIVGYYLADKLDSICGESDGGNDQIAEIKKQTREYFIKFNDIKFGSLLGKGNQGEVYRATLKSTDVAVKKIDCRKVEPDIIEEFVQEVYIWNRLRNNFITKFMGVCLEYPHLCIVTELMHRGSLFGLLHDEASPLTWRRRLRMAADLAAGMQFLHAQNPRIIHRDLKSLNVLVSSEWRAKVADFGMTRFQDMDNVMTTCGTPLWMAPEVIRHKDYDHKVDVYSYGICLWELYTRRIPYKALGIAAKYLVVKVAKEGLRPKIPSHCPAEFARLMRMCWQQRPSDRPEFKTIHKFITDLIHDPDILEHRPVDDSSRAAAQEEVKLESIVADFDQGKWKLSSNDYKVAPKKGVQLRAAPKGTVVLRGSLGRQEASITRWAADTKTQSAALAAYERVSNLRHPALLLFLGVDVDKDQNTVGVLTEIAGRGALNSTLLNPSVAMEWKVMLQIIIDLCHAMAYLHGQGFSLGFFSPERVYLTSKWQVKLDISNSIKELQGNPLGLWSAPETLQNPSADLDEKANVWTVGLLLWQMLVRVNPYKKSKLDAKLKGAIAGGQTPQIPVNAPGPLRAVLQACWSRDPSARPSFESLSQTLEKIQKDGPPPIKVDKTTGHRYCKTATVYAFQSDSAVEVTKEWGKLKGKPGWWIICNPSEDDLYVVDPDVFSRNYVAIQGKKNEFRKVGTVYARQMKWPFCLKTADGVQYGLTGDYCVRSASVEDGDTWIVDKITFEKIYARMDGEEGKAR